MNIEFLSQDKLKVDLSCSDLDKYDLDYLSISTESAGTRRMLKDILFEAGEQTGFTARDCRLLIEVLPGRSNGCVLYLTRMPIGTQAPAKEHPAGKRRLRMAQGGAVTGYILACGNIEDAIGAINCFAGYPDIPLRKSSLYQYSGRYLLTFSPISFGLSKARLGSLLASLSEYGKAEKSTPVKEALYAEHGCAIHEGRAVENFMRYFH